MNIQFSSSLKEALSFSHEEAVKFGSDYIGIGHLFLGLIRENQTVVVSLFKNPHVAMPELKEEIEKGIEKEKELSWNSKGKSMMFKKSGLLNFFSAPSGSLRLNRQAERAIRDSVIHVRDSKKTIVEPGHLLDSILRHADSLWSPILRPFFE
jgi:ATP-dependent Clp protease ATP-binding subunit ClpC